MTQFRKNLMAFSAILMLSFTFQLSANFLVITPDQIVVASNGLFVNIEDHTISVNSIMTANEGYLVAIPNPEADICPACGHDTYTPGRFCRWCNFPDDGKVTNKGNVQKS